MKFLIVIKNNENNRLANFRESNPDMFLPANLDISTEDYAEPSHQHIDGDELSDSPQSVGAGDEESPWIEVVSRKSSKRKLIFKSNGCRPYLESKRS